MYIYVYIYGLVKEERNGESVKLWERKENGKTKTRERESYPIISWRGILFSPARPSFYFNQEPQTPSKPQNPDPLLHVKL